jgi:hypothetical protein
MAANVSPIFTLYPEVSSCTIAAANTARDGSGTLITLLTASIDGTRVERIKFTSAQATAAANSLMVCRVFITDSAGANPRLLEEIAFPAVTASDTVAGGTVTITFLGGLNLKSGQIIKVSQSKYAGAQDQVHVIAQIGNY